MRMGGWREVRAWGAGKRHPSICGKVGYHAQARLNHSSIASLCSQAAEKYGQCPEEFIAKISAPAFRSESAQRVSSQKWRGVSPSASLMLGSARCVKSHCTTDTQP